MTENQLIAEPIKYEPYFNTDTNQYNDKCPWKKHFRGTRKEYKCPCNSFMFITTQQFSQHIKRGVHKKWLANYEKETKEMKIQEKELRIENAKLKKQVKKYENEIKNYLREKKRDNLLIKLLEEKLEERVKIHEYPVTEQEQDTFYDTNESNEID